MSKNKKKHANLSKAKVFTTPVAATIPTTPIETDDGSPWLSIIIPAHNCCNTIERLLNSIVANVVSKEVTADDIEVIICDDNSTDGFMNKVAPFVNILHIKYFKTEPREIHCPGNTRMDGWHHATGKWITFIDHDDVFEPDAFKNARALIESSKEEVILYTCFREWDMDNNSVIREYDGITWMHGKFYNRQWLIDEGIDFKENLKSHEDLYFNDLVFAHIYSKGLEFTKSQIFTYKWIYDPNSTSRLNYVNKEKRLFIEDYFDDYYTSAVTPWIDTFKGNEKVKNFFFVQMCSAFLYCYFYYQGIVFAHKGQGNIEVYNKIKDLLYIILEECKCTKQDIINHIKSIPWYYDKAKADSQVGSCMFIEIKSFEDFINET